MKKHFIKFRKILSGSLSAKFSFSLGILFLLVGIVLVCISLMPETLDDKYIISSVKEYTSDIPNKLKNGQIIVTKDTIYNRNAEYKLVFKNYAKKVNKGEILNTGTNLEITEVFGEGYQIDKNRILVNEKLCKFETENVICNDGISIYNDNDKLKIEIPNSSLLKNNEIEVYIKLKTRKTNYKYITSKESYYSFTPSIQNDFYVKKLSQSYVINGEGHIKLTKKK